MTQHARPGTSDPSTLNEVLAAEFACLRPGFKEPVAASTCSDDEDTRAANLRAIYKAVGSLDGSSQKGSAGESPLPPLSALCLSGGGIRSATFKLGVLQVLAKIGLLGKFDYLSSVSGGGYIAGWLRTWMHREGGEKVVEALGKFDPRRSPLAPEPSPVAKLREYSNYLTPKVGLFSGDTWAAAGTVARNLIL